MTAKAPEKTGRKTGCLHTETLPYEEMKKRRAETCRLHRHRRPAVQNRETVKNGKTFRRNRNSSTGETGKTCQKECRRCGKICREIFEGSGKPRKQLPIRRQRMMMASSSSIWICMKCKNAKSPRLRDLATVAITRGKLAKVFSISPDRLKRCVHGGMIELKRSEQQH